jgi:hypothetical protein
VVDNDTLLAAFVGGAGVRPGKHLEHPAHLLVREIFDVNERVARVHVHPVYAE